MKERAKRLLLSLIRGYQIYISGLHPGCCRYQPSCSRYALQAVESFGVCRGLLLIVWRILRCNPFSRGGYDPVPEVFSFPPHKNEKQHNTKKERITQA